MSKIAVVIPTRNRKEHLILGLVALAAQTTWNFEVIVADDGSTDGTYQAVMDWWRKRIDFRLKYYWHPHLKPLERLTSLARNQGARLAAKDTTHILFNDTDVLLNPRAIEHYYDLIDKHPGVVVCGRYDWLPPMEVTAFDVERNWDALVAGKLPSKLIGKSVSENGQDHRRRGWDTGELLSDYGGATLTGNLLVPVEAMKKTGGFDEELKHRGEDCEFGFHLEEKGFKAIYSGKVIGYHLSHAKDRRAVTISVRKGIWYICQKHNRPFDKSKLPRLDD